MANALQKLCQPITAARMLTIRAYPANAAEQNLPRGWLRKHG